MAALTVLRPVARLALIAMFVHASSQAALNLSHTYHTFDALIDHFTYGKNATFPLRYAMADQYWNRKGGPIFIYTANEGSIEDHITNTGIMWEWGRDFKALLVFPEHRYYGKSLPFGKDSFKTPEMTAYLTTEQALADYIDLVIWLKRNIKGARTSRVAAFGGHHAGMLATWFRTKYPHIVRAALASSAPFKMFSPATKCDTFYKAVTDIYKQTWKHCPREVKRIWPLLEALASTEEGCRKLGERFRLCQRLSSNHLASFRGWVRDSLIGVTLVNYPFRSSQVPPQPLKQCTEFVQPFCGDGVADMFYPTEWDYAKFCQKCRLQFGVHPKVDRIVRSLGGFNLCGTARVFFTYGNLDPWSAYGIDVAPSRYVEYRSIRGGAHCLDLRFSNDRWDPHSLRLGRRVAKRAFRRWLL
nr:lysosomal Pro-X carboxypeptidase-like [Rhipicephalus microplus]